MALLYSPKADENILCPEFSSIAVDGKIYSKSDLNQKKIMVFAFICNHCPYVKAIEDRWVSLAAKYKESASFVSVCSNDAADYPEDSFESIKENWLEKKFDMPYLYDENQKIAKDFGAVCTPDFFVFKKNGDKHSLVYRGRLDDSWKNPENVKNHELENILISLIENKENSNKQNPSMGCSIKWK